MGRDGVVDGMRWWSEREGGG